MKPSVAGFIGFLASLFCFSWLHAADRRLADYDGYFHIRFASMGPSAWTSWDFPWMPNSVFAPSRWVDHQLLFHAIQWPFTVIFPDLLTAAHASAALLAAGAVGVWTWAIARRGVPYPWLWALVLLGASRFFLDRMLMPRTQSLSMIWIFLGLILSLELRSLPLIAVGMLFAWSYHVSLVLVPLALVTAAVTRDLRPALYAALGVVLGFTIHPQSPDTYSFLWLHAIKKVLNPSGQAVGAEWMPVDTRTWMIHIFPLIYLMLVGWWRAGRAAAQDTRLLGVIALGWLVLSAGAVKWLEYGVPFLVFALALWWRDQQLSFRWLLPVIPCIYLNGSQALDHITSTVPPAERLQPLAAQLPTSGPCRVFHADWTDFSELFFYAPQCTFVVGLDPHFLSEADPKRASLVEAALAGQVREVGRMAREVFGANWVVTTTPAIEARAAADPMLEKVYGDSNGSLWKIR